jgi:hypothetical protein
MLGEDIVRVVVGIAGAAIVLSTLRSAIRTFVLPRGVSDPTARFVFLAVRLVFDARARRSVTYERRDQLMALFAPVALALLTVSWLFLVIAGYTGIYWSLDVRPVGHAFLLSGSSLFTLGFVTPAHESMAVLIFTEAGIGLLLAALLISYLPVIYGAWARRELMVATLEVRAGSPPSSPELIQRYHRIQGLPATDELWPRWEEWFLDIEESHTSLSALVFFRSPQPDRSWVNAAGVILDSAAMITAVVDVPPNPRRELCLRAGYICLRRVAAFLGLPYDPDPAPDASISVTRSEFDEARAALIRSGVPLKPDADKAWRDFAGWRVNYDEVLVRLAGYTMAPYAPWISDRSAYRYRHPALAFLGRR